MIIEQMVRKDDPTVEIEVVRLNEDNVDEIAIWSGARVVKEVDPRDSEIIPGLNVWTPTGMERASLGMYVVKYGNNFLVSTIRQVEELYTPSNGNVRPPESNGDSLRRRGFADPFGRST